MIAYGYPVGFETYLKTLNSNARTTEMLTMLNKFEALRVSRRLSTETRHELEKGEWSWENLTTAPTARRQLTGNHVPDSGGVVVISNPWDKQELHARLELQTIAADQDSPQNKVLFKGEPVVLSPPAKNAPMPGALARKIDIAPPEDETESALVVGRDSGARDQKSKSAKKAKSAGFDLSTNRILAVTLKVDQTCAPTSATCPVLNVQLLSAGKRYRDHYINLDFTGERTILVRDSDAARMLKEFRPDRANYSFKLAMYTFDFKTITGLNFRWMRAAAKCPATCQIKKVEALSEMVRPVTNLKLSIGGASLTFPFRLSAPGDYAEIDGRKFRVYDGNGNLKASGEAQQPALMLEHGENHVHIDPANVHSVRMESFVFGPPVSS